MFNISYLNIMFFPRGACEIKTEVYFVVRVALVLAPQHPPPSLAYVVPGHNDFSFISDVILMLITSSWNAKFNFISWSVLHAFFL